MVEDVGKAALELELESFGKWKAFGEAQREINRLRANERPHAGITKAANRRTRTLELVTGTSECRLARAGECTRIPPALWSWMRQVGTANHVGPLGRMFVVRQQATDALPYLLRAIKLRPDSIDAHRFLSDAYAQLGQQANARRELAEAERIRSQGGSRLGTQLDDSGEGVKQR